MKNNRLRAFVTIVELNSFSKAADHLFITQSALSQQIRTLENSLGFQLLDHSAHRVKLTNAGRVFYPRAKQIMEQYELAVVEAQMADKQKPSQPLRIGCINDQFLLYWIDLLHLSLEVEKRFTPVAMRFESRLELNQALHSDNADICIQMENSAITDSGLEFLPLTIIPEIGISPYPSLELKKDALSIEDLEAFQIAFHYPEGYIQYEDELRNELRRRRGSTMILNPIDFHHSEYGIPVLLMVPRNRCQMDKGYCSAILHWGTGVRVGFVLRPGCSPHVREFAMTLQDLFEQHKDSIHW